MVGRAENNRRTVRAADTVAARYWSTGEIENRVVIWMILAIGPSRSVLSIIGETRDTLVISKLNSKRSAGGPKRKESKNSHLQDEG